MKLASKSACALIFAAAVFGGKADRATASPMHSFATPSQSDVTPVACKYGKGRCANVKPVFNGPSTKKNKLPDPTVDPDCKSYGSCDNGGPIGVGPEIGAKKGTSTKTPKPTRVTGVKGKSQDTSHKNQIHVELFKSGGHTKGH